MNERLEQVVEDFRKEGNQIDDEEAKEVLNFCLRKMRMISSKEPEEYLVILYASEIRNFLFRRAVNRVTEVGGI